MPDEPGSTPAAEAVRAEMNDIMTNKANPLHAGYWAKGAKVLEQIDQKYAGVYGSGKVTLGEGLSVGGEAPQEGETPEAAEARARNEVILQPLRQEWGEQFEANFAGARAEARELFADHADLFDELGARIREAGPKAEALAVRFLADLGKLRKGA